MLYVYAIVDRALPGFRCRGVDGAAVRVVRAGDLHATISMMAPRRLRPSRARLGAHDAAVRAVAAATDAVLPARFGSVMRSPHELAERLSEQSATLRRALRLVRGREQMTLRLFDVTAVPAASAHARMRHAADAEGPGTRYLQASARRAAAPPAAIRRLRERLAPHAKGERVEYHDAHPLVATIHHLIPRGRSRDYLAAIGAVQRRQKRFRILPTGPWPAYAFAPNVEP